MRRLSLTLALLLSAVALSCGREPRLPDATTAATATTPAPTPTPKPTPDQGVFFVDRAMEHVRAIGVEIGKREAGTERDRMGAAYIKDRIAELGWSATEQPFPLPQGGGSTNVIGTPPGFSESQPYVLVGAHRDSINGPGANDNATGVAVLLEIARAIDARPAALPVKMVAFGAEEKQPAPGRPHHVGSRFYVPKMSKAARENLVVMINLDMVGHGDVIFCGRLATRSAMEPLEGTKRCLATAKDLKIAAKERVTPDWSDHGTFQKEGMNIAWLWTGELPCCYHNPRDTVDVVRADDVRRSGLLALALVRSYTR